VATPKIEMMIILRMGALKENPGPLSTTVDGYVLTHAINHFCTKEIDWKIQVESLLLV